MDAPTRGCRVLTVAVVDDEIATPAADDAQARGHVVRATYSRIVTERVLRGASVQVSRSPAALSFGVPNGQTAGVPGWWGRIDQMQSGTMDTRNT